jgi:hypothetical protein
MQVPTGTLANVLLLGDRHHPRSRVRAVVYPGALSSG